MSRNRNLDIPEERAEKAWHTLGRMWLYLQAQRRLLLVAVALVLVSVACELAGPLLVRRAIDVHVVPRQLDGLGSLLLLMLAVYFGGALGAWLLARTVASAAQRTIRDIRDDLFVRLQRLPLTFFDTRLRGELMARLTGDVESINQVLSNGISQLVSGTLTMLAIVVTMLSIEPLLGLVCVCAVGSATLAVNRVLGALARARYRKQQSELGRIYAFVEEMVSGQKVIHAHGREAVTIERFALVNARYRDAAIGAQTAAGMTPPSMNTINHFAATLAAGAGGLLALRGSVTIGTIVSFVSYTRQFGRPLHEIANLYNSFQAALAGAERVFEIMDEPAEVEPKEPVPSRRARGDVRFESVGFSYLPGQRILSDVWLHARPGQMLALIGPTGAGKTTLVNLLARFYEPESGRILLDGHDLRSIPREALRRQLGIVLQDTFLFTGTVAENIRYGRLEASDLEVEEAARLAGAHHFIVRLPHGYQTRLSERGSNLSQGERQMLSIARTILADPALLILDEATSSIDTRSEAIIQEALGRLMRGRTSFVIAHRLSTVARADQVLRVEGGRVTRDRAVPFEGVAFEGTASEPGPDNEAAPGPP